MHRQIDCTMQMSYGTDEGEGRRAPHAERENARPQWWVALLSAVGFALMLAAPLTDIAGLGAIAVLSRPGVHIIGVVLVGAGIAVSVLGQAAMGESWRGDVDDDVHTPLVTGGRSGSYAIPSSRVRRSRPSDSRSSCRTDSPSRWSSCN